MDKMQTIDVEIGVMQRRAESALIYKLFMDDLIREILHEAKKGVLLSKIPFRIPNAVNKKDMWQQQGSMKLLHIGFADDISALAESAEDLMTLVKIMAEVL